MIFGGTGGLSKYLMLISYGLHIIVNYGRYIFFTAISLLISSYLLYYLEFGYDYSNNINLIYRPKIALLFMMKYLQAFYKYYHLMNFKITGKLIFVLAAPYITYKTSAFSVRFIIFFIVSKLEVKMPTMVRFICRLISVPTSVNPTNAKPNRTKTSKFDFFSGKKDRQSLVDLSKFNIIQKNDSQYIKKNFRK